MVEEQIAARGVRDPRVLEAMRKVKRHLFVPPEMEASAYDDSPLPIGKNQTISQPYIVALMTELARLSAADRVLEIGTGSGYQAAILAELCEKVYTIEIIEELAAQAAERFAEFGYANIETRQGDGAQGWPEQAPFDAILVTAAPENVPEKLLDQLKTGGRLVIPLGNYSQELCVFTKFEDGSIQKQNIIPVRFVPMTRGKDTRQ